MTNSKQKGKRGELECAHVLRELGFTDVRRSVQYNGMGEGLADLIGINGVHIEVKRNEHLNIYDAAEQAKRDCKEGDAWVVIFRKNNKPWLVASPIETWAEREKVYQEVVNGQDQEK